MHLQHVACLLILKAVSGSSLFEPSKKRVDVSARGTIQNAIYTDAPPLATLARSSLIRNHTPGRQISTYSLVSDGALVVDPAIAMYDDNSCKGNLVYSFTASSNERPTGDSSSLCLSGTRFENESETKNFEHADVLPFSANYNCDGYKGQLSIYNQTKNCDRTAECVFELSDVMAEEFRKGGCAIVVWRHLETRAQLRACAWVQSIQMQDVSIYSFRGGGQTNDCSPGINFQKGDQDDAVPKSDEPLERGSNEEEKKMVFQILFPITILFFVGGTFFIMYWFQRHQKRQQAEAAAGAAERSAGVPLADEPEGGSF